MTAYDPTSRPELLKKQSELFQLIGLAISFSGGAVAFGGMMGNFPSENIQAVNVATGVAFSLLAFLF